MNAATMVSGTEPRSDALGLQKRYRPEIEGLRIVAAMLVAIYHIWFQRVSGGVDIFFVVSGFLVTSSLLSRYNREGRIAFGPFALNLLKRLLPNALVVLLFVTVASIFILPEVRHYSTMRELFASLFYYENWQLAATGTDYLDQGNEKSPVQHFWAMSIQGQFYIVLFLTVSLAIVIARRRRLNLHSVLAAIFCALVGVSLAFSVYLTSTNQPWAYFDTRTRLWEFAIGGLLTLVIFRITLPRFVSTTMGWIGLGVLMSTGLFFDVGGSFPGWAAMVPVGAAVFILLAGQNPTQLGVEKVLGSRAMVFMGGYSYGLYLWHWPLLSFFYVLFDTKTLDGIQGGLVIAAALALSFVTTTLVEKPMARRVSRHGLGVRGFRPIIAAFLTVLVILLGWSGFSVWSSARAAMADDSDYPGALAMQTGHPAVPVLPPIPALADIKQDVAEPYSGGCHQKVGESAVLICEYGQTEDFEYTVALVGSSKATHWLPSLEAFAEDESIRVLNVTKSGCRLSSAEVPSEDCMQWNRDVVDAVAQKSPDLVLVLADTADPGVDDVAPGILDQFARLHAKGLPILALRDTPMMKTDIPECLNASGVESSDCDSPRDAVLRSPSSWDRLESPPEYVTYADYTNYVCGPEWCPAVIGNVVAYIDISHMSATFSRSLGPIVEQDVMRLLEQNG
ncbi:MAG: acyltransferase family protein [Arachnia sp.]